MIVIVASGDTLSGIAAQHHTTYQALAARNHIANPDLIFVGEKVIIAKGGYSSWTSSGKSPSPSSSSSSSSSFSSASSGSSSGYHIPGMSDSTAACIAFRESTNGQASSNVFQITPGSGYNVSGMTLGQQEQVAGKIAASQGAHSAWGVYDGCA
jgi:peptidoglycan endopeptidase LytE